jgi:magnesium-transporting ATPase (P-type)
VVDVLALRRHEVYAALDSSARGLTDDEVSDRLSAHGPNVLPDPPRPSTVRRFLEQFTDLFAVVLLVASGTMFLAYAVRGDAGHLQLAVAIAGVVVLNAGIGFFQEYSAERTADALRALVPHTSRVIREGERAEVAARDLVRGDVVVLEPGDAVSADCRLVEAHELSVDNAALTGESYPVSRTDDAADAGRALAEARNVVFTGTSVVTGTAKAVVFATGVETEFGRIFRLTSEVHEERTPLQHEVALMARRVAGVAMSLGALLFLVRAATTDAPLVDAFVFALGVFVALVPEGLPATLSVSLAIGVRRMARRNALVKKLLAVETLGSTTVICTDKTGTLTRAEMTVQTVWASGRTHAVRGIGYAPEGDVEEPAAVSDLLRVAALCSDARLVAPSPDTPANGWRVLGDTTEGAIVVAAIKAGVDVDATAQKTPRVAEFPFDADRKLMSTVHRVDGRFESYVKGAPKELLGRCSAIEWNGRLAPLDDQARDTVVEANDLLATGALRVIGVARREVASPRVSQDTAEHDLVFLGLVGMLDPPRPEVSDAVQRCREAGIRVVMVTGDYGLTAIAIARRIGIVEGDEARIVTGQEIERIDDDQLGRVLREHGEVLFARVRPEHKVRIVEVLRSQGEIVAVTGDGVNDAPALKRADIGVAMGITGTEVAREASAMVLLDDSFASIAHAVELGRAVYLNIRKFLVYVFCSNVGELVPIVVAAFVGFPLVPLSALQVLAVDLGTDVLPALALGAEPPEPGLMRRPPRPRDERLFSPVIVRRVAFLGGIQAVGVVFVFFWIIGRAGIGFDDFTVDDPTYREAVTAVHAGIVVSQVFTAYAVRTDEQSVFRLGLRSNLALFGAQAVALVAMCAISYLPALQSIFNTAPLSALDWAVLIAFGAAVLAADEARKAVIRRRRRSCT